MQLSSLSLAVLACCGAVAHAQNTVGAPGSATPTDPAAGVPSNDGPTQPRALPAQASLPAVVVTGSRIPRIESEGVSPVQVLTRADIERTGVSSVKELIDTLAGASQLGSGPNRALSDIAANNQYFHAGSSAVALRHLGPKATLVLLNSRRLAPFGMDDEGTVFVNVDTLPLSAIERIEVLRSGASALYGSDAMAGVINIITRSNYRGVTLRASHEQSQVTRDFRASTASVTTGAGTLADDGYNLLLNAELYKRSGVVWRDALAQVNPETVKYSPSFGSYSTYSYPGNRIGGSGDSAVPGCNPSLIDAGLCMYDRYARLEAQPAAERANLLLSGQYRVSGRTSAFAELLYAATETRYLLANPAYGSPTVWAWPDPSTGQSRYFYERGLPAGHPLNTSGVDEQEFRYRFEDANAGFEVKSRNYRALTGLRGVWDGYDWEAAFGLMGSRTDNIQYGGGGVGYSVSGFHQVIGNDDINQTDPQFFNRDYRIGQPNSPAVLAALFPTLRSRGTVRQRFVDGKFSGPWGAIEGRPIQVAAGAELRHETMTVAPDQRLLVGDIVGYGVAQSDGQRDFGAVFGELSLPVRKSLELQTAARIDKYAGLNPRLSPKLGLRLEAAPSLLLRGTVEGGFRAPSLPEQSQSTLYSYATVTDPRRCPQAEALAAALRTQAAGLADSDPNKALLLARAEIMPTQECAASVPLVRQNNPALRPETSVGGTAGLVFEPTRGHLGSLDYWRIDRRNEIGARTAQALLNAESGVRAGTVNRMPAGQDPSFSAAERTLYGVTAEPLASIYGQYENTAKTTTSGFDLGWASRWRLDGSSVMLGLSSTYLMDYRSYNAVRGGFGDNLAGRYQFPRWRGHLSAGLQSAGWVNALRLNFASGTKLQGDFYDTSYSDQACLDAGWSLSDCRVKASTSWDYFVSYTGGVPGLTMSLMVRNLLNQRPPVDLRAMEESGRGITPQSLADVQRRTLRLALEYKFQ